MMSELSFLSNTTYYTDKTDVNPVPLDAYGASDNGTYNKIEKYATKLGIDPRGLMRGYSWVKQNLPMIKSLYKNGRAIVKGGSLATRLAAGTALFKDGFPLVAGMLPDDLAKTIEQKFTENQDTIIRIGQTAEMVKDVNFKDLSAVGGLLSNLTGTGGLFEIEDRNSITGVMAGLCIEGCRNGIPGVVNTVLGSTGSREIIQQCLKEIVPDISKLGNIEFIKDLGEFCADNGFTLDRIANVEDFLKDLKYAKDDPKKLSGIFKKFTENSSSINGNTNSYTLNGEEVPLIWTADKMSPDAIKALTTDVKQGHVPPRHIAGAVHKQEPWKPQLGYKGNVSRIAELNAFPPLVLPTITEGSAKKAKRL